VPELVPFKDFVDICTFVADKTADIAKKDDCPYSEFAILYVKKTPPGDSSLTVPEMIERALASKGIFSNWVSKNYQNKCAYDITTNSVAVSTIHSAKGFDYACVFLIGLDTFDEEKLTADHIERLAYVGITRARYQLFIPYVEKTSVIEKMLNLI
jgi:superfamily I DNA/RNA helicase